MLILLEKCNLLVSLNDFGVDGKSCKPSLISVLGFSCLRRLCDEELAVDAQAIGVRTGSSLGSLKLKEVWWQVS